MKSRVVNGPRRGVASATRPVVEIGGFQRTTASRSFDEGSHGYFYFMKIQRRKRHQLYLTDHSFPHFELSVQ
jgi:hypothetical protein